MMSALLIVISVAYISSCASFSSSPSSARMMARTLRMEYIPDGFTKEQWQAVKKKEAEELKKKGNLGALGTTKFKSRSFEAWQKAGGKHLFPVDPTTTPYEERPYMQRKDGDWEGTDLKKKGLQGRGQGAAAERLKIDGIYDKAKAEGRLDSPSIFGAGFGLDWTGKNKGAASSGEFNPEGKQGARPAGKQLSPEEIEKLKKNLAKVTKTVKKEEVKASAATTTEAPKKKGFFGLF